MNDSENYYEVAEIRLATAEQEARHRYEANRLRGRKSIRDVAGNLIPGIFGFDVSGGAQLTVVAELHELRYMFRYWSGQTSYDVPNRKAALILIASSRQKLLMADFTPGPWVVHDMFPWQRVVAESGNRVILARMGADSVETDARLIAAAPAMLEALMETARLFHLGDLQWCKGVNANLESYIEAVINKVKGSVPADAEAERRV